MKRAVLIIALVASFIALFPLSFRLANPFFTYPFHKNWRHAVLLIWPDHVEARWFDDVSEVSPRPKDAPYTFNVEPEREAWVKQQVRMLPSPNGDASWTIRVKQLAASRQQIQFELLGDGVSGIIYDAGPDEIVPLRSRLGGPGGAFIILAVNLALWGSIWLLLWAASRFMPRRRKLPAVSVA
jgi:hypothetical protein